MADFSVKHCAFPSSLSDNQTLRFIDGTRMTVAVKSERLALKPWTVPLWCLPCLLAFLLFFFSFPIDRKIPFWPHLNLAELYALWFLLVTPISTFVAVIVLARRRWMGGSSILAWFLVIVSVVVNAVVLLGLYAAFAF